MNPLPDIEFSNLFSVDPTGQKLWSHWLHQDLFNKYKDRFLAMGAAGAVAQHYSAQADKHPPTLQNFNAQGDRIDAITYHPAYQKLKELSYGNGIVSLKYNSPLINEDRKHRHLIGFGIAYYFAQTETGLFCPICMTDALGRVLERHNTLPQTQKALKHISSGDLSQLWEGAMFMTEKQGGSDVGANTTTAETYGGRWFLSGDKWFCSNADAKVLLALARMPGPDGAIANGTRGLGLFLVLRDEPQQNYKSWLTHRLKDKLGVKSMASGEITFNKTEAFLIGGADQGFKIMTEMVNMSRLYNAVASLGIVRRSLLEASAFGKQRAAFGHKLQDLPLWRASLADLSSEHLGLMVLVFEAAKQLDKSDQGDARAGQLMRLLTPISKAIGGKLAVFSASEAMELIGGNAYIEEHILPRLLRDAQVLPIWEGTTNIQSLDLIRALHKEGASALTERCQAALATCPDSDLKSKATQQLTELTLGFTSLQKQSHEDVQRQSRKLLESAARTTSICLLLELSTVPSLKDTVLAAAQRLMARPTSTSPLGGAGAVELKQTEDALLQSIM